MVQIIIQTCSICRKPSVDKFRPFCSARCANVDLGHWLHESYAIPAENKDFDAELDQEELKKNEE